MYAQKYKISETDVANLFEQKKLLNYLFNNYTELHTQEKEYFPTRRIIKVFSIPTFIKTSK